MTTSYLDVHEPRSAKRDIYHLEKYLVNQLEDDYQEHCVYMKEWQGTSYPTCNSVHELGIQGGRGEGNNGDDDDADSDIMTALSEGGWRQVFVHDQKMPESVLKMLHLGPDEDYAFDMQAYEIHRVDAVISQRLTSSPYVMDIHGYCGTSAFYEKGTRSLKRHLQDGVEDTMDTKYRIMMEIVLAMVDMHSIDYPNTNNATMAHRDLKPSNIMMGLDGKAKLGDFNDSILKKWNKRSGEVCPFYNEKYPLYWGLGYKPAEHAAGDYPPLDESVDIYGLGGLLFFVLTEQDPFREHAKQNMTAAIQTGLLPRLPDQYNISQTPDLSAEIATVVNVIERAMVFDPKARPTAKQVLEMLQAHLGKYMAATIGIHNVSAR